MAYQRFGAPGMPEAYIWSSGKTLHLCVKGEAHDGSHYDPGVVEVVFGISDTTTAENLFRALYDHLTEGAGLKIRLKRKARELRIAKRR